MSETTFDSLGLSREILEAVNKAGYESPSPIQQKAIPVLLKGKNLLGTAQTGTGKTAAFSLPLLSRLDFSGSSPAMLVLTPTRELSIQVAEAIQGFASFMPKIKALAIYGGQDINVQLKALKRNASIVIATPGRLLDHIRRGTVKLSCVQAIVLDEADEMLDMGFMEEVESILKEIPNNAQRALFSATMPEEVRSIVERYLGDYEEVRIEGKTTTVENILQRYIMVKPQYKLEALTRVLESETADGILIFVRTKQETAEVAERLEARGFNAAPLSGDLAQTLRERTINRLKIGKLDIVVATDVAARGIDVDRITHVVNYDVPYDTESYVHRIGRTGRAGRSGNAILFVTPREKRLLKTIEKATRQPIAPMEMPTGSQISEKRVEAFKNKIIEKIQIEDLSKFKELIQNLEMGSEYSLQDIASALAFMAQESQPLFPEMQELPPPEERGKQFKAENTFGLGFDENKRLRKERKEGLNGVEEGFLRYYLGVGRSHHVSPKDIVGAIAGESGISSADIGRIKLFDKFSTVELPEDVPEPLLQILERMSIRGNPSKFRIMTDESKKDSRDFVARGSFEKAKSFAKKDRSSERKTRDFGKKRKEKPFREKHGDTPFRKTRRFGRH